MIWFAFFLALYGLALLYALRLSRATEFGDVSDVSDRTYRFADASVSPLLGILTFSATLFSTFTLMGLPDFFRSHGIGAWIFLGVTDMAMVFLALWFGMHVRRRVRMHEFDGVGELLSASYGATWVRYIYWAGIFVFLMPYVAIQIKGVAGFLEAAFPVGLPVEGWALVILGSILVYSYYGGMRAIIYNDAIQGMALLVITLIIAGLCLDRVGGLREMFAQVQVVNPELLSIPGPKGLLSPQFLLASFLAIVVMPVSQPQLFTRFTMMRDDRSMIEMTLGLSVFSLLIITPTIAIGMYGALNYPDLSAPEFLVRTLVTDQPEVIGAFAVVGLLAAAMSTADSQLFALESEVSPSISSQRAKKLPILGFAVMAFALAVLSSSELVLLARVSFSGTSLLAPMIVLAVLSRGDDLPPLLVPLVCGVSLFVYLISLLTGLIPGALFGVRLDLLLLLLNAAIATTFFMLRYRQGGA